VTALKRLVGLLGTLIVAGLLLSLSGGPSMKYMLAPGALLLVLGMTTGLGLFTYDRKRFFGAFKEMFSKNRSRRDTQNKRMLSQLALYALISGLVLALVQILLQSFRTLEGLDRIGSNPVALRAPLTTLLYAVLTALGLWLISGQRVSNYDSGEKDVIASQRQIMMGASLLLFMTIGLVVLLVAGMTRDDFRQNRDKSPPGAKTLKAVSNEVEGLYQGEDLYWRPTSMQESKGALSLSPGARAIKTYNSYPDKNLTVSDASSSADEMPLRWELSLDDEDLEKDRICPYPSQTAFP
jgi:hypothetical protein